MTDHVKILFPLEQTDGYPPHDVESVWAVPLGGGKYRLDNIPFFVRGVSSEDVVSATERGGALFYAGLSSEGGHSTVRVLIADPDATERVREELRARGCSSEGTGIPGLIAVDVPPAVSYRELRQFLDEGERRGRWEYEEGCIAHPA